MNGSGKLVSSLVNYPTAGVAGLEFVTDSSSSARFVATLGWEEAGLIRKARKRVRMLLSPAIASARPSWRRLVCSIRLATDTTRAAW